MPKKISTGVAHELPTDLKKSLSSDAPALEAWESLTPLSRNEWICWTISVKTEGTRADHVGRVVSQLKEGDRRPCCWSGCIHRTDKPMNATQKWLLKQKSQKKKKSEK